MQLVTASHGHNADVVGLDVAMRDAFFLKPVDGDEEVFAKALQQIGMPTGTNQRFDGKEAGKRNTRCTDVRRRVARVPPQVTNPLLMEFWLG